MIIIFLKQIKIFIRTKQKFLCECPSDEQFFWVYDRMSHLVNNRSAKLVADSGKKSNGINYFWNFYIILSSLNIVHIYCLGTRIPNGQRRE